MHLKMYWLAAKFGLAINFFLTIGSKFKQIV